MHVGSKNRVHKNAMCTRNIAYILDGKAGFWGKLYRRQSDAGSLEARKAIQDQQVIIEFKKK